MDNMSPEQIKQMISMLQAMLPSEGQAPEEEKPYSNSAIKSRNIDTKNKKKNKFTEMAEFAMHKEDIEFDKKVTKLPPVPRTRQFVPVEVKCRVCGKTEKVNPSILDSIDRYKCNKCSSMAG